MGLMHAGQKRKGPLKWALLMLAETLGLDMDCGDIPHAASDRSHDSYSTERKMMNENTGNGLKDLKTLNSSMKLTLGTSHRPCVSFVGLQNRDMDINCRAIFMPQC